MSLERWQKRLENFVDLVLPTDYPRQVPPKIVEADAFTEIPAALVAEINSKFPGKSLYDVVVGCFAVLLHRYTQEEDIVIGSSSSSSNPLVLRFQVTFKQTIMQVVEAFKSAEKDALSDEIALKDLVDGLFPDHQKSLFKVRFVNQYDGRVDTAATSSSCDMAVFLGQREQDGSAVVKLVYNSVLFSEARIKITLEQLLDLLRASISQSTVPLGEISLASHGQLPNPQAHLDWEGFKGPITDIFSQNAKKFPSRICVTEGLVSGHRKFTYKQIDDASNVVANHLLATGIEREDVVVLYSYRGVDLVVAIIGVLKAGATFSVIDPAYPPARQCVYLKVSQPKGLIVLAKAGVLSEEVTEFVKNELKIKSSLSSLELADDGSLTGGLDSNGDDYLQSTSAAYPGIVLGPDSIGTLSFTSGSTGIPKGVRGRHHSLTYFYPWMSREFQLGENERFTMLSGIAHDPIQRDIFTPLFLGARICIPTSEDIGVPGKLAEWMANNGITVTHLTPAMGQLLSANATTPIPSLRNAFFVGDVLSKRDVTRLQHLAANTTVINMYGTTETQRAVSYLKIPPVSVNPGFLSEQKDIMPAGKGMENVQLLVINNSGLLAGVGEVGEIFVRSGGLAEGYLGLGEATAEKFLTNPFIKEAWKPSREIPYFHGIRDRMYKTGDLGRYMPDGNVECTGRADDQVKIRGFRIELKEIDTHLSQHPDIRENITLVRRDKDEEKTLVCYFVPLSKTLDEMGDLIKDIRNYLKQKLATYAIPSVFVPLTRMPLTPNGKIDKNALPFPDTALAAATASPETNMTEMTPLESSLCEIWSRLLKIPASSISLSDNFFDLGGHSILATQLVFEVRKSTALEVPLGMVYRSPILKDMVAELDYLRGGDLNMTQAAAKPSSATDTSFPNETSNRKGKVMLDQDINDQEFDYAGDLEKIEDSQISANGRAVDYSRLQSTNPTIFVTGVTGFLGAFILASCFKKYADAKIITLVRAKDDAEGLARVTENCKRHIVWSSSWERKLFAYAGDLGKERFGFSEERWTDLCENVDVIIHNGALVHWIYPYMKLRAPNVEGTLTALKMSTLKKLIPIHFVSSTSVLDTEHYTDKLVLGTSVYESDDLMGSKTGLRSGYGQTKWVAEQLIFRARSRGCPATIIRPGYIVGDSRNGVTNTDDFIWRLVKGCIQLGQAPRIANVVNMCPVDYVADCVVEVAANPKAIELGVFHTWNPHGFKFDDLFAAIITNFGVTPIEYIHWRTSLMELTLSTSDHALFPLLHFVLDDLPTSTKSPELDDTNTREILKPSGISCQKMDRLLPIYLGYLLYVDFLPRESVTSGAHLPILKQWGGSVKMVARSGQ